MLLPIVAFVVAQASDVPLVSGLGITGVTQGGRAPVPIDTVQSLIVDGKWTEPHAGDSVPGARGSDRKWEEVKANKDGVFEGGPTQGGYVYTSVDSDVEKPMLLQAAGDTVVYINGEPRAGDPYSYGYLKVPFLMKKGHNTFLFSCGRGRLQAKLVEPKVPGGLELNEADMTLPDLISGNSETLLGAIPVINSGRGQAKAFVLAAFPGGTPYMGDVVEIPPFSIRKIPFKIGGWKGEPSGDLPLQLLLVTNKSTVDRVDIKVQVRKPTDHYKRTFVSGIDGSVQYYAVTPSLKPDKSNALVLTVHGASVEATNQANAYKSKDWCTIVAATNRRPYGFDWEDWGRMDAMEVWNIAKKEFPHDPQRVILTGHSMGGHGAWTLGLTYPGQFAAVGPSAGWISFWSYAGGWEPRDPNPVEQMLRRSMNSSDTLLMLDNAKTEDIYILHGDKDDNVPVEQARTMKQKLTDIGAHFEYHEEPGAGHWWGDQCVDWPPMFEMFNKARFSWPEKYEFVTVNPGVSSACRGIQILQQIDPLLPSRVSVETDKDSVRIVTHNVAKIQIGTEYRKLKQFLDGQPAPSRFATLKNGRWIASGDDSAEKKPWSTGPFKLAFQNRMVLVVGTHGTPEENEWATKKARFDAEQWYYRGNGAVDVVRDGDIGKYKDRNLILYGNADTNSAFKLIDKCPIQVRRNEVTVGGRQYTDSAVLFLYPQGKRMIAVVGGTSTKGLRLTDRLPYFTSGVAYPDWTVLPASSLTMGSKGVAACGFFGNDWKFDEKQSAFLSK